MKHKSQKILLNKRTVSRLNAAEMESLHGGIIVLATAGCIFEIIKPQPDPWKPDPTPWIPGEVIIITG